MPSSSAPPRQHGIAPRQHARINLSEIKTRISKRLGPDRSNRYFSFLNRFFSNKITKQELNKQCIILFGHENIQLHNQLVRSILKNSLLSKTPPPQNPHEKPPIKSNFTNLTSNLPNTWCNGGILPISPRKIRSGTRERKFKDPIVPPNGLTGLNPLPIKENGAIHNLEETEDQIANFPSKRPPIEAPIGIPFCRPSIGGAQFGPINAFNGAGTRTGSSTSTFASRGELSDTFSLKTRIENIVKSQGLEGISAECAEVLNRSLDLYLKRLIGSVNSLNGCKRTQNLNPITLEDFNLATQLNPSLLGENFAEQRERISERLFEQKDENDKKRK